MPRLSPACCGSVSRANGGGGTANDNTDAVFHAVRPPLPARVLRRTMRSPRLAWRAPRSYSLSVEFNSPQPASVADPPITIATMLSDRAVGEGSGTELRVTVTNTQAEPQAMVVAQVGIPSGLQLRVDKLDELVGAGQVCSDCAVATLVLVDCTDGCTLPAGGVLRDTRPDAEPVLAGHGTSTERGFAAGRGGDSSRNLPWRRQSRVPVLRPGTHVLGARR